MTFIGTAVTAFLADCLVSAGADAIKHDTRLNTGNKEKEIEFNNKVVRVTNVARCALYVGAAAYFVYSTITE